MDCKETEASLSDSKVCTESSHSIDTVILLAKGGCTQATPDPEFSRQLDHLDAPNISTYYISPIEFTFVNQDLLRSFLARPNDWSGLILTSKRCVDAVVLCLAEMAMRTILLSEWSQLKIFTVGEATSTYLFEQCQLGSIGHHSGNATSLGEFILQSFSSTQSCKPLLYPCSNIRSDFITDLLRDNVVVQELICYETLANQQIDRDISLFTNFLSDSFQNIGENMKIKLIVVFFSPSGVEHLLPLLRDNILTNSVFTDRLSLHFVAFGKTTASKMTDLNIDVWFISSAKIKSLAVDIINHLKGTSQINENVKPAYRTQLESWLNKNMKIKMSDKRTIVGIFLCTDCHMNIILGSSLEYLKDENNEEPRMLGLAMIPGEHIVSIHVDQLIPGENN